MIFLLCIIGIIVIGWFVPKLILRWLPGRRGVMLGVLAALAAGVCFIWIAAAFGEAIGYGPSGPEFERGFNAWKIILLLAPAAALHHHRRSRSAEAGE